MEGSWKGGCVLLVVCGGSRLQVHPPQQVLEARVVAEAMKKALSLGARPFF